MRLESVSRRDGRQGSKPLLFVQFGDFQADYLRLSGGGPETYQGQRRSVSMVTSIATAERPVVIVNVLTDRENDFILAPGLRVIGLGPSGTRISWYRWWRLLSRLNPERMVVRTPLLPILLWASWRSCPTLAVLADSFQVRKVRDRMRRFLMGLALSSSAIEYVGNHGRAASWQLEAIGVPRSRIIPWDVTPAQTPEAASPKSLPSDASQIDLLFAGHLTIEKGADDAVAAVAALSARGIKAHLTMLGPGDKARIMAYAGALGIDKQIDVVGLVESSEVVRRMRLADFVTVPSRHNYSEGLPLTIYEAFSARTPVVASDHPMFVGNLEEGCGVAIFPAGNPYALAARVAEVASSPSKYEELSASCLQAWRKLQLPVKFEDLVLRWLRDDGTWLNSHTLAQRDYRIQ